MNYKYRMHDPRIGRFFAVDPLAPKYPHNSPYAFSENMVIHAVELEGLEASILNDDGTITTAPHSMESIEKAEKNDRLMSINPDVLPMGPLNYGVIPNKIYSLQKIITMNVEPKYPPVPIGTTLYNTMDEAAISFAEIYGPANTGNDSYEMYEHTANIFYVGNGKFALGNTHTDNNYSEVNCTKSRLGDHWDIRAMVHTHPGNFEEKHDFSTSTDFSYPHLPERKSDFWKGIPSTMLNGDPGDIQIARYFGLISYIATTQGIVKKFIPGRLEYSPGKYHSSTIEHTEFESNEIIGDY